MNRRRVFTVAIALTILSAAIYLCGFILYSRPTTDEVIYHTRWLELLTFNHTNELATLDAKLKPMYEKSAVDYTITRQEREFARQQISLIDKHFFQQLDEEKAAHDNELHQHNLRVAQQSHINIVALIVALFAAGLGLIGFMLNHPHPAPEPK